MNPHTQDQKIVTRVPGAVGYCHLWILGFAEIAKPLYSSTGGTQPLEWFETEQQAFEILKTALTSAPTLSLPDVTKSFHLYICETRSIAKGVFTQSLGPWKRPVAYLSKRLNSIASGWPLGGSRHHYACQKSQ